MNAAGAPERKNCELTRVQPTAHRVGTHAFGDPCTRKSIDREGRFFHWQPERPCNVLFYGFRRQRSIQSQTATEKCFLRDQSQNQVCVR